MTRASRLLTAGALGLLAAVPARAQVFAQSILDKQGAWEQRLKQGDADGVRREAEALLAGDAAAVSPSSYNDIHAVVGLRGLDARACVAAGDWESAADQLAKAAALAASNLETTEATFAKVQADHQAKLKQWQDELGQNQDRLSQMENAAGLTQEQLKLREQLKTFVAEHQTAIQDSQAKLKQMDDTLAALKQEKADYDKSAADWQAFIAKQKLDIDAAGGPRVYVAAKVAQVKADDTKPTPQRLAYARRLARLDPANKDVQRLLNALLGRPQPEEAPRPRRTKKG